MGLGFNQPPRHCSTKHDHPPGFPSPITTPDGGHGILNENQVHTQSNLPAPEIHPVKEEVSELEQAPEPNFNLNPLLHSPSFKQPSRHLPTEEHDHPPGFPIPIPSSTLTPTTNQVPAPDGGHDNIQVLSQVPSQNDKETAKTELGPRGRRRRRSPMRRKSHPYKKYGPYTCSQCHVVFESVHRFAAHYQNHYKDETPAEKKKRHE
ncbi:Obscurin, partial [Bienertia sinuspersici]